MRGRGYSQGTEDPRKLGVFPDGLTLPYLF
jgi:hypothetical protein